MKTELKTSTVESLLGVLSLRPMSGYEMRQFMEYSTGNFWRESFGQIYPALKRMVTAGLVTVEEQKGDGHPAKKVYRMTEAGAEHLRGWLGIAAKPQVPRNELLLKVFFGDRAEAGAIAMQVREWKAKEEVNLQRYERTLSEIETKFAAHPGMPFWRMTARYGIAQAKALIGWCEATLEEMQGVGSREQGVESGGCGDEC
ncbi:MAG: PadR family transcriptional regulator [Acidobacteriota bacterium]